MAETARGFLSDFLRCAGGDPAALVPAEIARRRHDPMLTADEIGRLDAAAALIADRPTS